MKSNSENNSRNIHQLTRELDQVRQQLEAAQKVCAEMRECCRYPGNRGSTADPKFRELQARALSTDRGKGWLSPEKVKALVEAVETVLNEWADMRAGSRQPMGHYLRDPRNEQKLFGMVISLNNLVKRWDSAKKDL